MNIAPGPNGDYDQAAYDRLKELASWIQINQGAVYATRPVAPYHEGDYYYTRSKDSKTVNVFHIVEGDSYKQPTEFTFNVPENFKIKDMSILGHKGRLKWTQKENQIVIKNPGTKLNYATVIQLKSK
ncbi:hypothetical protein D3C78_1527770 [compost metagenome]